MAYQSDCADVVCQIAGRINSPDIVWRIFTGGELSRRCLNHPLICPRWRWPAPSMKPKPCVTAGWGVTSTGRSAARFTNSARPLDLLFVGGRRFAEWVLDHLCTPRLVCCNLSARKKVTCRFEGALARIALAGFVSWIAPD